MDGEQIEMRENIERRRNELQDIEMVMVLDLCAAQKSDS